MAHLMQFKLLATIGGKKDLDNNIEDDYAGYQIYVPSTLVYAMVTITLLLLIVNVIILSYHNCCKSSTTKKTPNYSKVSQIVSSDDDMQNLKEYPIWDQSLNM